MKKNICNICKMFHFTKQIYLQIFDDHYGFFETLYTNISINEQAPLKIKRYPQNNQQP